VCVCVCVCVCVSSLLHHLLGHNALRAPLYDAWLERTEAQRIKDKTHVWLEAHVMADAIVNIMLLLSMMMMMMLTFVDSYEIWIEMVTMS
jgi:hypothetical protein